MPHVMEDKWSLFSFGAFANFPKSMQRFGVFSFGVFTSELPNNSLIGRVGRNPVGKVRRQRTDIVKRAVTDIF